MNEPYTECPRYHRCSVNMCPLDPHMHQWDSLPEEPRCSLPKSHRLRIALQYPEQLPWLGLWPRELAARRRWEARSTEDREEIAARGRAVLAKCAEANRFRFCSSVLETQTEKGRNPPTGTPTSKTLLQNRKRSES